MLSGHGIGPPLHGWPDNLDRGPAVAAHQMMMVRGAALAIYRFAVVTHDDIDIP